MLSLEYKRSLLHSFVSQRFCLFSGSFVGGKGLCSEEKAQKYTPFEGLLRSGDTRRCLWHAGVSRYLSGHILLVGHHYVAATAWMKRRVFWDTCQRSKDTINRCMKQRLPSSSLSMAYNFMSFCAHTSRPWLLWLTDGQGTGCPGLSGEARSLSPNHSWGLTPDGAVGVGTILIALRVKVLAGMEGLAWGWDQITKNLRFRACPHGTPL